jgi:hypothetical protein
MSRFLHNVNVEAIGRTIRTGEEDPSSLVQKVNSRTHLEMVNRA